MVTWVTRSGSPANGLVRGGRVPVRLRRNHASTDRRVPQGENARASSAKASATLSWCGFPKEWTSPVQYSDESAASGAATRVNSPTSPAPSATSATA